MGNDASIPSSPTKSKRALYEVKDMSSSSDSPVVASFDSEHMTIGAGVAIFHLASSRVVVCYHSTQQYWFLPKGRRDANEETGEAAEREGFEEVRISVRVSLPFANIDPVRIPQPTFAHRAASSAAAGIQSGSLVAHLV